MVYWILQFFCSTSFANQPLPNYHSIKTKFGGETYIELIKNAVHRYRTTKLRISAHDFEIERGRYSNIPREERICRWCSHTLGKKVTEDEAHVLYQCDLYADARNKLINSIKRAPSNTEVGRHITTNFNFNNLSKTFMTLLSPFTNTANNSPELVTCESFNLIHSLPNTNDPTFNSLLELRSYITKFACEYINRCFEKRLKFIEETTKSKLTSLVIILSR